AEFVSSPTFRGVAEERLERMWRALHREPAPAEARSMVAKMLAPWGDGIMPRAAPWPSDIGDDGSPFELSVAFSGDRAELRFLAEAQGGRHYAARRRAVLQQSRALEERGADLRRFSALMDLFLPEAAPETDPLFLLWHTVSLEPGPLRAKAYLNPN